MNSILFMFVAFLGLHYCKIGIFSSNLAKEHGNYTSAKEIAKKVEGSLRSYLEKQLEEEPPKHQRTFSYVNIMKLFKPQAPKEKIEIKLFELFVKVAHQKSKKGLLVIIDMLIKAIETEDYIKLIFFLMVVLRYRLLIVYKLVCLLSFKTKRNECFTLSKRFFFNLSTQLLNI